MQQSKITNFERLKAFVLGFADDDRSLPWGAFPCADWTGCRWISANPVGTKIAARIAYIVGYGSLDPEHTVFRMCGNLLCVRPVHLRATASALDILRELIAISPTDPHQCVEWPLARDKKRYGRVISPEGNGRTIAASRAAWILAKGPIEGRLEVCHDCDNPPCVRLSHLFLGTHEDNMRDALKKELLWVRERAVGAKLKSEQVLEIRAARCRGISHEVLAREFKVSKATIFDIEARRTWKSLTA